MLENLNPNSTLGELKNAFHSQTSNLTCAEYTRKWLDTPLADDDKNDLKVLCEQFNINVPPAPIKADLVNLRSCNTSAEMCASCNKNRDNCFKSFPHVEGDRIKVKSQFCNLFKVQTLIDRSGIPSKFMDCRADDFTVNVNNMSVAKMFKDIYTSKNPQKGVFVYGNVGTGKTMLSAILVIERAFQGLPSLFYTVTDMLTDLKDFSDSVAREIKMRKIKNTPCLVIDDLGAEYVTDWVSSTLFEILDARYKNTLLTIINSNIAIGDLQRRYGDLHGKRIVRRIQELCQMAWLC